jgi:hypothetical protein
MSGPWAEEAQLYVRVAAEVKHWPLRIWTDQGLAMVECAECDSGELLVAARPDRAFMIADLAAQVELHIGRCPRNR